MDLHAFFISEVKPTMGCTEPGAVAYAAAVAASYLDAPVESVHLAYSEAVFKNGRSVGIPGTHGLRGLPLSGALGALGGDASRGLMSLAGISLEKVTAARDILAAGKVTEEVVPGMPSMWVTVTLSGGEHRVSCTVAGQHDHVERITRDGVILQDTPLAQQKTVSWTEELMDMDFARLWELSASIDDAIAGQMLEGARVNMDIINHEDEGLGGLGIGKTLSQFQNNSLLDSIKQVAGSASDLRMSGGDVTVMSSAGSGNHGIVAIIPVAMAADRLGSDDRTLAEALALSHLVCGYIKAYTGRLTPTCGCAVAAGAGAASGIVRLHGGTSRQAELAAVTLVGTLLGMICDGAKESCGLKVSSAAGEAWASAMMALNDSGIQSTQGIISPDIQTLGATLKEFNEKIFSVADAVMINLMTRQPAQNEILRADSK